MAFDIGIVNARIVDGTGAPWFRGAVGITDGRIDAVSRGTDPGLSAETAIDVDGAVVCPGFVDTHTHSDLELFADPTLRPKIRQGITTEILGQDGFSMAPIYRAGGAEEWQDHLAGLAGRVDVDWSWESTAGYFDAIEANGIAPNVAMLVGHGTVRYDVIGMEERSPTEDELVAMADRVTESLEHGAIGFSTGLIYSPHTNADTHEVQTLASRLAPTGRPFVAHIRSESEGIWAALDEFVDVGAEEGIPLHLSHYKVSGAAQHGKAARANEVLEAARDRGVDITAEQYPYTAGNTMLSSRLPSWVHADGPRETLKRIADPDIRRQIKDEFEIGGPDWSIIDVTNLQTDEHAPVEGMSVAEISERRDQHPVDVVCEILLDEELGASVITHSMAERDVREIMTNERVCVATDGLFGGKPHPRTYGTYPRILGHYVRDENLLTLEAAVRKMTSLPARVMGLQRKGLVRPGMDADLVVFDPDTVKSRATFESPRQYPVGIPHVLVNGEFVVRDGTVTDATPGTVIRA